MTDTLPNSTANLVSQVKEMLPASTKASATQIKKALAASNNSPEDAVKFLVGEPASDASALAISTPREAQASLAEYGLKISLKQSAELLKQIDTSRGAINIQTRELIEAYQAFLAQKHAAEMSALADALAKLEDTVMNQNMEYAAFANARIEEFKSTVDMGTQAQEEFLNELRSYMGLS